MWVFCQDISFEAGGGDLLLYERLCPLKRHMLKS